MRVRAVIGWTLGTMVAALGVGSALAATAPSSGAVGVGGQGSPAFGASPSQLPNGQQRGFFEMNLGPGQSASDTVVVTNQGTAPETLAISPSTGVTAPNSGDAYTGYFKPCFGTGCWVSGLPSSVTLGPGQSQTIPFTLTVPGGTAVKQYLAGITIQPAQTPQPQQVGGNGRASAQAIIIHQVNIGVAVTVGDLASMTTSITIPNVKVSMVGNTPRLNVGVQNTGQTFFQGPGSASCTGGGNQATLPFTVDTVLPGESATLPVNAPEFAPGTSITCSVSIGFGQGQSATWHGPIVIPSTTPTTIIKTGPNSYAAVPLSKGIPAWAYALFAVGGVILILLIVLLWIMVRRKRRTEAIDPAAVAAAAAAAAVAAATAGQTPGPSVGTAADGGQVSDRGSGSVPPVPEPVARWLESSDDVAPAKAPAGGQNGGGRNGSGRADSRRGDPGVTDEH